VTSHSEIHIVLFALDLCLVLRLLCLVFVRLAVSPVGPALGSESLDFSGLRLVLLRHYSDISLENMIRT